MDNDKKGTTVASGGGIGFLGLLQIVFIVLKLTRTIDWSWVWVLAPIWMSVGLVLLIGGVFVVLAIIARNRDL